MYGAFVFIGFYIFIIFGILFLVFLWAKKMISLGQERNELLRAIADKLDKKQVL